METERRMCGIRSGGVNDTKHNTEHDHMKRLFIPIAVALSAVVLLTGCLALDLGGGNKSEEKKPTLGQQLIDLKAAKDAGAISDDEYQTQKAKLLSHR